MSTLTPEESPSLDANTLDSMLHHLLLIHLYRPFLKYTKTNTPLPPHVSPRKICTQAASAISKLLRIYKRSYGLRQVCNLVVYIAHTACTVHLLNLPEKNAQRDVIHGVRNLEEMAEGWLCARRTLRILDISASKWQVELPPEATAIFERTHAKWGSWGSWDQATSPSASADSPTPHVDSSVTSPSRFSPSEEQVPPAQRSNQAGPHHLPSMVGASMGPQYPPTEPVAVPIPTLRTAARAPGVHSQLEYAPEPTYLRPMSSMNYAMSAMASSGPSAPSPTPGPWYDTSGAGTGPAPATQMATQHSPTELKASPVSGLDATENLVEESQDWWSRNAAVLGLGMEGWSGPWNPEVPSHPSHLQYGYKSHLMQVGQQPSSVTTPEQQSHVSGGVAAGNRPPGFDEQWKG